MRLFFAFFASIIVTMFIFFGMEQMISLNNNLEAKVKSTPHMVYLRDKKESIIKKKSRIKPKEPPKQIELKQTRLNTRIDKKIKIQPLNIQQRKINISSISSLSGAKIAIGRELLDARMLIASVKRNPRYPRKAKIRKLSGFVQLVFTINKDGTVSNARVLDSKPKGIFEKSSLQAIKKMAF